MNTIRFSFFTLIVVTGFMVSTLAAQDMEEDVRNLSLQETIEMAKQNSPEARAARYALLSSRWAFQSFRADLLPGLSLTGNAPNYRREFRELLNPDGSTSQIYTQQSNANVSLSIAQPILYTGGTLSLSSGIQRLGIFPDENTYLWSSTPMAVTYRQPLFQYNNLKWRNRLEPLRFEIAQKQYVERMEDLSWRVTQRYFDVLLTKVNLDIADFNLAVNDSIYNISQGRYNVGSIAENDLLQAELELRQAQSRVTQANISYDQQLSNFRLLLGLDSDNPVDVEVPEEVPDIQVDVITALEMARQNNSTALNYLLQETQAEQNLDQAIKQSNFSADLTATYGLNQTSTDFGSLYDDPLSQQFVTLSFQVPIFNWGKQRAEVNAARNNHRRVTDEISYQQDLFDLEIQNAVDEFRQLKQQVDLAELSDGIADRRYEVARNRYLIGRIDITNLFIAQNQRDSARQSYIQALRNYWVGIYNLRRLTLYDFEQNQIIDYDI